MVKKFFNFKTIIFAALTVIFLLFIPKITGLLLILFASFIISAALNPAVNYLQQRIKSRSASTAIVVVTSIVALFSLILPIIVLCIKEGQLLLSVLPQKLSAFYTYITDYKMFGHNIADLVQLEDIGNSSTEIAQSMVNHSLTITASLVQGVIAAVIMTMVIFYILVDKDYLRGKFIEFFPPAIKDKASYILSDITTKVGYYVRAQVISMAAVGVMVSIALVILRVDYAVLLGLISGVLDIIPILGPAVALLIIVAVASQMGIVKIVLIVVAFLVVQQISNYVVRPFLFGKFMKIHPITILVALFLAQQFLGLWGIILSPAIAATVCVLIDELYLIPINEKEQGTIIEQQ